MSGQLTLVMLHFNVGGGLDRDHRGFASWGVIGELPVHRKLRLVAEVNGTVTLGRQPDNSGLVGVLWQPMSRKLVLDAGVRRGFGGAAPDWQFTFGLTFGFFLPTVFSD